MRPRCGGGDAGSASEVAGGTGGGSLGAGGAEGAGAISEGPARSGCAQPKSTTHAAATNTHAANERWDERRRQLVESPSIRISNKACRTHDASNQAHFARHLSARRSANP